jgi:hypothetical protein
MRARSLRVLVALTLTACSAANYPSEDSNPRRSHPPTQSVGNGITLDPSVAGPRISSLVLGANMAMWYDNTQIENVIGLQIAGLASARWPGGAAADDYNWQTNSVCKGYTSPNSSFDLYMNQVAIPAKLDVAITLNYGSDPTCSQPGDPAVAAQWVNYANNVQHYGISYWTVGNESYGSWETDLHANKWDPWTYADAVKNGYYPQIKAVDAHAQVGVVVSGGGYNGWDQTVLSNTPYDFVELHYYDQNPGEETDTGLVLHGATRLADAITRVQNELSQAGRNVPIYLGELGSVNTNPGKQTMSITQALFAAQAIGTIMQLGIQRATWWLADGGCNTSESGNFSPSLYGWQNYGGYMMFSDGLPNASECTGTPNVMTGTLFPTARAYQLLSKFAVTGEHMIGVSVPDSLSSIRAWAATSGQNYALLLVNTDSTTTKEVPVAIKGRAAPASMDLTIYGKNTYDESYNNVWDGPSYVHVTSGGSVEVQPWSITVVIVHPVD